MSEEWISVEDNTKPLSGDSIWVLDSHGWVDYAVVFADVDGLIIHRFEAEEAEPWPGEFVTHWMPAEIPTLPDENMPFSDSIERKI